MRLRIIILGCGSSAGVPRLGGPEGRGDWGDCDPAEPRNRRRRCSILVQRAHDETGWDSGNLTTLLIDTSPDMREQLLSAHIGRLDAVAYTHDHADQSHGIDDLRALVLIQRARVPVYYSPKTSPALTKRFEYCFKDNPYTGYPAILDGLELTAGEEIMISGPSGNIPLMPVSLGHGPVPSLGFRVGRGDESAVYSPDADVIPDAAWPLIEGAGIWIVDALRYRPHPSHAHLERSLEWLNRAGVKMGILTNLHIDLDYRTLKKETPAHVTPAFDGMEIHIGEGEPPRWR